MELKEKVLSIFRKYEEEIFNKGYHQFTIDFIQDNILELEDKVVTKSTVDLLLYKVENIFHMIRAGKDERLFIRLFDSLYLIENEKRRG